MTQYNEDITDKYELLPATEIVDDEEEQALRALIDEARAERLIEETNRAPSKLEKLKLDLDNEKALRDCVRKFGAVGKGVHAVYTDLGIVIVKRPSLAEFRLFQGSEGNDASARLDAMDSLVQSCVVWPSLVEFRRIENANPMIMTQLAGACSLLAGAALGNTAKKS